MPLAIDLAKRLITIASRRSRSLSLLCFTLGLGFLLSLPFLAKDGYTDERALLIGLAGVSLRPGTKYLPSTSFTPTPAPIISNKYKNYIHNNQLSSLSLAHFLSQFLPQSSPLLYQLPPSPPSSNSSSSCQLAHNVMRASRGDGSEGIVFLFIVDTTSPMAASSAGLSLLAHLPTLPWLSKDVAIVFASQCKDSITAATTWLDAYNYPSMYPDMPRAGQLQQAIVIESGSGGEGGHSTATNKIDIRVQGSNGRLPNYDLVRVLTTIATQYHRHLPITINGIGGRKHQSSSSVATSYNVLLRSMLRFMYKSAVGSNDGGHSAFIDQTIDAATVVFIDGTTGGTVTRHSSQHILEYLEMVVRTSSNMHERFHHSTNMYIPFGSFKFAPVSLYIAGPGLLLTSLTFLLSHQVNTNANSRNGDISGNIVISGGFLAIGCYLLFSNWCQCVLLLVLGVPMLGVVGSWKKEKRMNE